MTIRKVSDAYMTTGGSKRGGLGWLRGRRWGGVLVVWCLRGLLLAGVLSLWQLSAAHHWLQPVFTGDPTGVGSALMRGLRAGTYWPLIGTTLYEVGVGYSIGAGAGFLVGLIMSQSAIVEGTLRPFITSLNNLPRIALAPLFVLWFGLGSLPRIVLGMSLVFFILVINTYAALSATDRDFLILARSLGTTKRQLLWKFILPSGVPTIFAGLQLGLTYTILGVVVGEMMGGIGGIGASLSLAVATYHTNEFFALLAVLMVVALAISAGIRGLERYLLRWRQIDLLGTR